MWIICFVNFRSKRGFRIAVWKRSVKSASTAALAPPAAAWSGTDSRPRDTASTPRSPRSPTRTLSPSPPCHSRTTPRRRTVSTPTRSSTHPASSRPTAAARRCPAKRTRITWCPAPRGSPASRRTVCCRRRRCVWRRLSLRTLVLVTRTPYLQQRLTHIHNWYIYWYIFRFFFRSTFLEV